MIIDTINTISSFGIHTLASFGDFISLAYSNFIVAAGTEDLMKQARTFVAPIVLAIISFLALTFLFKRQMMQFLTFIIIAIVVAALFYAPELLANLGKDLGESNKKIGWK